jgi:uncharacterized protein
MLIFLTGGTGLVGKRLQQDLLERGHSLRILTRRADQVSANPKIELIQGDPAKSGPWMEKLTGCDGVIHLAGEPILGGRWTTKFKAKIRDSRVDSTHLIATHLAGMQGPPKVLISASAIGIYGSTLSDQQLDESSPPANDFLGKTSVEWEAAAEPASNAGIRVVHPRIGIVLDAEGGALKKMLLPFKLFLGGPVASGVQWMSWIHVRDLNGMIAEALENPEWVGPFNAVAPEPVKNWGFGTILAEVLHRPFWLPVPSFVLRLMFGEASILVIYGQRVLAAKARDWNYRFRFPLLKPALADLLKRPI